MTVAEVNIPVAVLIWLMIVPMLLKVDFGALHRVAEQWRGIAVTVGINWLVKPFSMALLGWLFIGWLFRPFLPAGQIDSYIAGLIILAAAPCTAMVFVWSNLTDGDPNFTLSQVALNDTIMVSPLHRSWLCCSACPRSRCHGRHYSSPWSFTLSCL
jgi:ACR3 family arsenite transporter